MEQRFSCFPDARDDKLSPLAAAACFVDPTIVMKPSKSSNTNTEPPTVQEEDLNDEPQDLKALCQAEDPEVQGAVPGIMRKLEWTFGQLRVMLCLYI